MVVEKMQCCVGRNLTLHVLALLLAADVDYSTRGSTNAPMDDGGIFSTLQRSETETCN